jgi:hypothetical protein
MAPKEGNPLNIRVSCYAGYRGEETPKRFQIGSTTIEIEEILDRWIGPNHRYFKVRGEDQATYIIRHDVDSYRWELTFFKNPRSPSF